MTDTRRSATDILIGQLQARQEHGTAKYGQPLRSFDGRNTAADVREELLDAAVYMTKLMAEREQCAELLDRAAQLLDGHESRIGRELAAMARQLRADVPRVGGAS